MLHLVDKTNFSLQYIMFGMMLLLKYYFPTTHVLCMLGPSKMYLIFTGVFVFFLSKSIYLIASEIQFIFKTIGRTNDTQQNIIKGG